MKITEESEKRQQDYFSSKRRKKKERKFDRDFLSEMGKLFANNEISNKNADKNF